MKYQDFKFLLDVYSSRAKKERVSDFDLGKVRERFSEIVDAVGIDSRLLKQHKSEQTGEMVKFGRGKPQFCFPETICDFCAELLLRYTSPDFKKIRSADFTSVDPATSLFLIDGFTRYLQELGHDIHTIILERWKMDRRLHHHTNVLKLELFNASKKLVNSTKKYEQSLGYEDSTYFIRHMTVEVNYLIDLIEQTFFEFESARLVEISEVATVDSAEMERGVAYKDRSRTIILADALEYDENYQKLLKKLNKIIVEPGFKQGAKGRYHKIVAQLSNIRKKYEAILDNESYENYVSEKEPPEFRLKHPMEILCGAVLSALDNQLDQIAREEAESCLSEDQIRNREEGIRILRDYYEKRGVSFDLPCIDDNEEELFVNEFPDHEVKGIIKFPCCKAEKVVVYKGSTGCSAIKCPQCGQISIFDFDKMVSETVSQIRHSNFQSREF